MARKITLKKFALANVNYRWVGAFRLRIEASDPQNTGADPNVFLYQRNLANPYDETVTDVFLAVASAADLADYPAGEPNNLTAYPFYRLSYVELDLRSVALGHTAWLIIIREVNNLLLALDELEELVPIEEVELSGAELLDPDDDSSISEIG